MTEDQAVAWLLLEGYVVMTTCRTDVGEDLRWVNVDGREGVVPTKFYGKTLAMGGIHWNVREFKPERWHPVSDYPQYAPAVVKLLTEKENEP